MEKNNKLIVSNSIILYFRLIIVSIIGLFVTRIILKNLGIVDFGVYTVIGGIVSLIAVINTVMLTVSNRFIAFEIGRGTEKGINRIFNVCFNIHLFIAIVVLFVGLFVGEWYIHNYLNIEPNRISDAIWVLRFSLLGSVFSFIGVPYIGLLTAKELFYATSIVEIVISICKLFIAFFINIFISDKLIVYAALMALITALPTIIYAIFCRVKYNNIVRYKLNKSWDDYKQVFSFAVWSGYGTIAWVGKAQGANLLINYFFGTNLNAALGIANSVNGLLVNFAGNIGNAITPQITKSFAADNVKRTESLVIANSKFTFLLMLIPATPIIIETDFLMNLWLVNVPVYSVIFIKLLIVDSLIISLYAGVTNAVFASGNIMRYQFIVSTISLFSLPIAYIFLIFGNEPISVFYIYIGVSFISLVIRQFLASKILTFNSVRFFKILYFPVLSVLISLIPLYLLTNIKLNPIFVILIAMLYTTISIFIFGFKRQEKRFIFDIFKRSISKLTK